MYLELQMPHYFSFKLCDGITHHQMINNKINLSFLCCFDVDS